jgi:predicted RNase H-like nuclease (RuvC/YqgF family)
MPMGEEEAGMEAEEPAMEEGAEMAHDEEENIDEIIEAILRETEDMEDSSDVSHLEEENAELKGELEEAYSTVKQLKSVINEVNLLNAKLLYTNKLFRNFELNETQKMKVIENFDRAANTREAKLVFATLAESFNKPKVTPKRKMVKESIASKPVATTAPSKETTQILSEGFEMANRWKKLAGLI